MMKTLLSLAALLLSATFANAETVRFKASDGVEVTADFNTPKSRASTVLVLYHMAGASRGEYTDLSLIHI